MISSRSLPAACLDRFGACVHVGTLAPATIDSIRPLVEDQIADQGFVHLSHDTARTLAKHSQGAKATAALGVAALAALFVAV